MKERGVPVFLQRSVWSYSCCSESSPVQLVSTETGTANSAAHRDQAGHTNEKGQLVGHREWWGPWPAGGRVAWLKLRPPSGPASCCPVGIHIRLFGFSYFSAEARNLNVKVKLPNLERLVTNSKLLQLNSLSVGVLTCNNGENTSWATGASFSTLA